MPTPVDLRCLALCLPEVEEVEAWGHPTFRVRGKMVAIVADDGRSARVKATREAQVALTGSDPETFSVAPYLGHRGWVRVDLERVDPEELCELLAEAWLTTAPKRLVREHEIGLIERLYDRLP